MRSSTSLKVTWLPPNEENGKILKYTIYYKRVGSDKKDSRSIVATSTERNKTIQNLKPYTNYSVEVAANTSAGYGRKSKAKFAQTNQAGKPLMDFYAIIFQQIVIRMKTVAKCILLITGNITHWIIVL